MAQQQIDSTADFFSAVWQLIGQVLRLNPVAYERLFSIPDGWQLALAVLIIAGISYEIGQSVVLFANKVSRKRFLFSLIISALALAVSIVAWAFSIWALVEIFFDASLPASVVLTAVSISFAPYIFGFLILLPYLGNIIFYILRIWVLLAVIVGVQVAYQIGFFQSLLLSLVGWGILELLTQLPILHLDRFDQWLWQLTTGKQDQLQTAELVERFVDDAKSSATGDGQWN